MTTTQLAPTATATTWSGGGAPAKAAALELMGPLQGSGYRAGTGLVRRSDGQVVQLGPLMYAVLDCLDGYREERALAAAVSERLGRTLGRDQLLRLLDKLGDQGLLEGTEEHAPPRRHPLLALRWRLLVTNPRVTRLLTAPFLWLFRPWVMWPVTAAFVAVCWFVLVRKGVASATAQSFAHPGLLLLVFVLAVVSCGVHEIGHAAACRYGGGKPGGMGVGLYLVWPAFYTDVTDAYRMDRRSRLRVDLAGLYFNAAVAVGTMVAWLVVRVDALLLIVALQLLQMLRQLSPVIRADGYHILSDATGVPDLYAHLGPTLRRLLPGRHRAATPVHGWARVLVTVWVLVIVPVMLSLLAGAVLFLPRLLTSAWDSGRHLALELSAQVGRGDTVAAMASVLGLVALAVPVGASLLIIQKFVRTTASKARRWSSARPLRQAGVALTTLLVLVGLGWAWWPAGQYQPVRANERGTVGSILNGLASPASVVRPHQAAAVATLASGHYLALAMIPVGGSSRADPAMFFVSGSKGGPPVAVVSARNGTTRHDLGASVFPFALPAAPGPGGTQAVALGTRDHGVTYKIAYAVLTVRGGQPVTASNQAFALANCDGCTTVAVSVQVVLVVGHSAVVAPLDTAVAANRGCPACATTAIADQLVATIDTRPPATLERELESTLAQLNLLPELGANGTPTAVAAQVSRVQSEIDAELNASGLLAGPITSTPASSSTGTTGSTGPSGSRTGTTSTTATSTSPRSTTTSPPSSTTTSSSSSTTTTTPTTSTTTTTAPSTTTTSGP